MKAINVSEFKAQLSRYFRMASRGTKILVKDRDEPIAQLGPPEAEAATWHERLARMGRLRMGSQAWTKLKVSRLGRQVDIQSSLRGVREAPGILDP